MKIVQDRIFLAYFYSNQPDISYNDYFLYLEAITLFQEIAN